MTGESYLAVDIGASSGRHILGQLEDGVLKLKEIYRFENGVTEKAGSLYWDADHLFREIITGLKKAADLSSPPHFIGIDTWAVDYLLLDKEDRPLGAPYSYRDKRGASRKEQAHAVMDFPSLYRRTGIQYAPFNTLYQLYDDRLTGRLDGAESFLMLPDYFHFLLTGVKRQEYTNATSTGMVNALTHRWDEEILSAFSLPKKLFGPLSQPSSVVGPLKKEITEEIGYQATVILPATHDTASAVLAAPVSDGAPYLSSGTWSLLGITEPFAHTEERAMTYNYSNEGSVNYTFRCQKNIIGLWMIQRVKKELGDRYSFKELADLARLSPTNCLLDLKDSRYLAPESMIAEIEKEAGKQEVGALAYTVFNSLAFSYGEAIRELESLTGRYFDALHVIGGGCQNTLLNELTHRHTGKKITAGPVEATAIGNILAQMIGTGEIPDLDAAREIVMKSFDITEVKVHGQI